MGNTFYIYEFKRLLLLLADRYREDVLSVTLFSLFPVIVNKILIQIIHKGLIQFFPRAYGPQSKYGAPVRQLTGFGDEDMVINDLIGQSVHSFCSVFIK